MASLLPFSLDWGRLLMEKQLKQCGRQVVQSQGGGCHADAMAHISGMAQWKSPKTSEVGWWFGRVMTP